MLLNPNQVIRIIMKPNLFFHCPVTTVCAAILLGTSINGFVIQGKANPLSPIPLGTNQVALTLVASNLHNNVDGTKQMNPTGLFTDDSGRLFITTLGGIIRVMNPQGILLSTPYLNTTRDPVTGSLDGRSFNVSFRHGLTSLAFHPDFFNSGKPGYGKFYTLLDQTNNSGPANFTSLDPDSSSPPTPYDQVLVEWTTTNADAYVFQGTRRELFRLHQPK